MPRDPRDPYNHNNNHNHNHNQWPWGEDDAFGSFPRDPFFEHFDRMREHIFRDFFGKDMPSIFIEHSHPSNSPNAQHNENIPDLSQINPNAKPPTTEHRKEHQTNPSIFRIFDNFFHPECDDHKLSDINPNITENGPIMNNDEANNGIISPQGPMPGFRSPYFPNWNGAEKRMQFNGDNGEPKGFYRSESVIISTGPDGKTTKTVTVRDSNGQQTTTTEEIDGNQHKGQPMIDIFDWNHNGNGNENEHNRGNRLMIPPMFERTVDPFEKWRRKWQQWKWNPFRSNGGDSENYERSDNGTKGEWIWRHHDQQQNDKSNEGIKWKSYRDYKSDHKRPSLLDDIVKPKE